MSQQKRQSNILQKLKQENLKKTSQIHKQKSKETNKSIIQKEEDDFEID